jgi:hypothetical protein
VLRHEQEDYWTIARASFASTVPLSKEFSCTAIEKVGSKRKMGRSLLFVSLVCEAHARKY